MRLIFVACIAFTPYLSPLYANQPSNEPECTIKPYADDTSTKAMKRHGLGFKGFASLCTKLKLAHMEVSVSSHEGVLAQRSFGHVVLRVRDIDTGISSTIAEMSMTMNRDADSPGATKATNDSINNALTEVAKTADKYIENVTDEKKRLRGILAEK